MRLFFNVAFFPVSANLIHFSMQEHLLQIGKITEGKSHLFTMNDSE